MHSDELGARWLHAIALPSWPFGLPLQLLTVADAALKAGMLRLLRPRGLEMERDARAWDCQSIWNESCRGKHTDTADTRSLR